MIGDSVEKRDPVAVPASLFTQAESFGVGAIPFDLLISESHGLEFEAAEHAIEDGSAVTDHVRRKLRSCTVVGMFSAHSISLASGYDWSSSENRVRELVDSLEALAEKRNAVRLVTSMKVYPEMLITSIQHNRDSGAGEATKFTMTLREFKRVQLKTVIMDSVIAPPDMSTDQNRKAAVGTSSGRISAEQTLANKISGLTEIQVMGN